MLEALPSAVGDLGLVDYCVTGHSGSSSRIPFVDFGDGKPSNEKQRMEILEKIKAHAQYSLSGDNTIPAINQAVGDLQAGTCSKENTDRFVLVVSDANFDRYGISPQVLSQALTQDERVQVHAIFIASFGEEAQNVVKSMPAGRTHLCFETTSIPSVFRSILTSRGGVLET